MFYLLRWEGANPDNLREEYLDILLNLLFLLRLFIVQKRFPQIKLKKAVSNTLTNSIKSSEQL